MTLGRRPAVIVQNDNFNASKIATTIVIPLTTNTLLAEYKDNIREQLFLGGCPLPARAPQSRLYDSPFSSFLRSPRGPSETLSGMNTCRSSMLRVRAVYTMLRFILSKTDSSKS